MTVIAFDGKSMAADKMLSDSGVGVKITKIHRIDDNLIVALSGDSPACATMLAWLRSGGIIQNFPDWLLNQDNGFVSMIVWCKGGGGRPVFQLSTPYKDRANYVGRKEWARFCISRHASRKISKGGRGIGLRALHRVRPWR